MKRKAIEFLVLISIFVLVSLSFAGDERVFKIDLSGKEVVPSVNTKAKGEAEFKVVYTGKQIPLKGGHEPSEGKELKFKLMVNDIENVAAAHIHIGKSGENGPPIVTLFKGPKKGGKFSGLLSEGSITEKEFIGPLKGKSIDQLIQMIELGQVYVNVHTEKYPDGEIRGQVIHIRPAPRWQ